MTKHFSFIFILLLLSISIRAQQSNSITALEYFWNTDPGYGNGTSIALGSLHPSVDITTVIPMHTLSFGMNRLYIRAKDSYGEWSHVMQRQILLSQQKGQVEITEAEFFWNTDPGFGNATPLNVVNPSGVIDISTALTTSTMSEGIHKLYIRAKNSLGEWSHVFTQNIFITQPVIAKTITEAEYFIDQDPGFGNGNALTFSTGGQVSMSTNIDLTTISPGVHRLYLRAKNNLEEWSHVYQTSIFVLDSLTNNQVTAAEYYWDTDPGHGNGNSLSIIPGGVLDLNTAINNASLSPGMHQLYVRSKDSKNRWSHTYNSPVWILDDLPSSSMLMAEYFWDTDPGLGNGNAISVNPSGAVTLNTDIQTSNLSPGIHMLYLRSYDDQGRWSHTYHTPVYIMDDGFAENIVAAEYFWDTDPGAGSGMPVGITTPDSILDIGAVINTSGLSKGMHRLYVRTKDYTGKWSHTFHTMIFIENLLQAPDIVEVEYFWDTDPGYNQGVPIAVNPADSIVDISTSISTANLSSGLHRLHVRAKDDQGKWSHNYYYLVYISKDQSKPNIVEVEYFWDTDPGFGQGVTIALPGPAPVVVDTIAVPVDCNLSNGSHLMYVRTKDDQGKWSHTYFDTVNVSTSGASTVSAGPDDNVCDGDNYSLAAATASSGASANWTTSGDGNFNDNTLISPVYTPGPNDISSGVVTLTITVSQAGSNCPPVSDDIVITINPGAMTPPVLHF